MKSTFPRSVLYFLGAFLLINLLQSYFTELIFDEAYYWHYAQHTTWGHFDHPPMVAWLIKLSGFFFQGELGVRFMSCILSTATLAILWLLVDDERKHEYIPHFFVLTFSMTLLNAYGFLTLPDTPLLFFTALLLWLYKKFLYKPSTLLAFALGIAMAALMYSKYHAVLVILFVLLSNLSLLKRGLAWVAVAVALLLYIPHLNWLLEQDLISIKYHLFERPNRAYDFNDYTLGFFVNLIALFGLTFPWIYLSLFKTKSKDKFTRALLFLTYGVLLFFFVSSFTRRIQTQWIILICIPLVVIVFREMIHNQKVRKWIMRLGIVNGIILVFLRIGLIYEPFFPITYETHGNKKWVQELYEKSGGVPVVFENSYREAPMYSFYSGKDAYSLNNYKYRQNEYSIDNSEFGVQGQKVAYIAKRFKEGDFSYQSAKGDTYFGHFIAPFESFRKLRTFLNPIPTAPKDTEKQLVVYNPYDQNIALKKLQFGLVLLDKYKHVIDVIPLDPKPAKKITSQLMAKDSTFFKVTLPAIEDFNPIYYKVSISENKLLWGLNGVNQKIK